MESGCKQNKSPNSPKKLIVRKVINDINQKTENISLASRSVHTSRGMRRTKEMRRFLLYCLYAWGVPTVLTVLTVIVDYFHLVPEKWSPQMGAKNMCWFARESFWYRQTDEEAFWCKTTFVCDRWKLARSFHLFLISNWIAHCHQCHSFHPYCCSLQQN